MNGLSFGGWLKQRRKTLDLTQQQLALLVGCATTTIKKFETNQRRPSSQMADRLAIQLRVSPDERVMFIQWARGVNGAEQQPIASAPAPTSDASPLPAHMLPTLSTLLIGRADDLASICSYLRCDTVQLLTLTGPPGVGKTRLSLQAAVELREWFPDGVYVISAAAINDTATLITAITQQLGLYDVAEHLLLASLRKRLSSRAVLLVLDNFEHLLATGPWLTSLLGAVPTLKALVTSREVLRVYGEQVFRVAPLSLPNPAAQLSAEILVQSAAVALFTARAQAVDHTFSLTDDNAQTVAALCRHLDGLPLAIELAAARILLYSPYALLTHLRNHVHVLTGGPRDMPLRHQTLRAAIDWSYHLLRPEEQRLFRHLGIFMGGCTAIAITAICVEVGDVRQPVLDQLAALLDKSLVQRGTADAAEERFNLLETIRDYALAQTQEDPEGAAVEQRHMYYYLEFAETAQAHLGHSEQQLWMSRLEIEQPNLRVALRRALSLGANAAALRLVSALWKFWHMRGHQREGLEWIDAVLAQQSSERTAQHAWALYGAGWLRYDQGDTGRAGAHFEESLGLFRQAGDAHGTGLTLHGIGELALVQGAYQHAHQVFAESLMLFRSLGDTEEIAWSLDHLGRSLLYQGDAACAAQLFEEELTLFRAIAHGWGIAYALTNLGGAKLALGQLDQAHTFLTAGLSQHQRLDNQRGRAAVLVQLGDMAFYQHDLISAQDCFTQSLILSEQVDYPWCRALALEGQGRIATHIGAFDQASTCFTRALEIWQQLDDYCGRSVLTLERITVLAAACGDAAHALRLGSAARALRQRLRIVDGNLEQGAFEQAIALARQTLAINVSAALWAEGSALSLRQAVDLAGVVMHRHACQVSELAGVLRS